MAALHRLFMEICHQGCSSLLMASTVAEPNFGTCQA